MIKTYDQIYAEMQQPGERYTLLELINIFEAESSWCGTGFQMMQMMELITNITGIRPGSCSGCRIDALQNMVRWKNNYEKTLVKEEPKRGRKAKS